jgi:hypothetical protein
MPTGDIGPLVDAVTAKVVEAVTERLAELVNEQSAEFRDRHQQLADHIRANGERGAETQRRVADIEQRITELKANQELIEAVAVTAYNRGLADAHNDDLPPIPSKLISACHQPAGTLHWVTVEVMGREVHRRVTGGSDAEAVWRDICASVRNHATSD